MIGRSCSLLGRVLWADLIPCVISTVEDQEDWNHESGGMVPVGMDVVLHGLSKASFNGLLGTVITTANEEGRQGVRLESTGKSILVKSDKMKPQIR